MCDDIAVLKDGKIVEIGDAAAIFDSPKHPYTQHLIHLMPHMKGRR
jgi:oligopeptide/dipeptide ABC transporter ATP-binding protein